MGNGRRHTRSDPTTFQSVKASGLVTGGCHNPGLAIRTQALSSRGTDLTVCPREANGEFERGGLARDADGILQALRECGKDL